MLPPPPGFPGPVLDIIASAIVVIASGAIFWRTRDIQRLSGHGGVRHFRYAFLFFAITFLTHLARPVAWLISDPEHFLLHDALRLISTYAGTMAVLSLLASVLWKRIGTRVRFLTIWLNIASILFAVLALFARLRLFALLLHTIIFACAVLIGYTDACRARKGSRVTQLYLLYTLLFVAWMANAAAGFVARFSFTAASVLSTVSAALFLVLLVKVWRRTDTAL